MNLFLDAYIAIQALNDGPCISADSGSCRHCRSIRIVISSGKSGFCLPNA